MLEQNYKVNNLDEVINSIKPYLRRYLEERNIIIDGGGKFSCINPKHEDKHPSCGFIKESNEEAFYCFSCNCKGSITDAAYLLEGKPISGKKFITDNVIYLADKYGVEYKLDEISDKDLYIRRVFEAYQAASDIISEYQPLEYIKQRQWPVTICRDLGIGSVRSYSNFTGKMNNRGFENEFLDEVDLNFRIFNEGMLIFTVKNHKGNVVGFSSRDMSHSKESKKSKFINTSAKCPIYHKSNILYGLHAAIKEPSPLYIVEGYPDCVSAYKHGMRNVCAIGGTALTREHVNLLKEIGLNDCILALDGDDAGQNKIQNLLDTLFSGDETIKIRISKLPSISGEHDPDEYIEKYGIDEFKNIPLLTSFQWRLDRFPYDANADDICDKMIPFIMNDPNDIHRESMAKELANSTGIRLKSILRQVDKLINAEESRKESKIQIRLKQVADELRSTSEDPIYILESAAEDIRKIHESSGNSALSKEEFLRFMDEIEDIFSDRKPGLQGWATGFPMFDSAISGIPKEDSMITFAGDSNVGKCIRANTRVMLSNGTSKTIREICEHKIENILTFKDGRIVQGIVSDWIDSGKLECFNVKTRLGREIEVSSTHPFYTIDGWKKISDLFCGDYIAVSKSYNNIDSDTLISRDEAIFLGLICGDGGITKDVRFTNKDKDTINLFKTISSNLFPGISFTRDGEITYRIKDPTMSGNRAKKYLESIGLFGSKSINKVIPDGILKSSNDVIANFLGAIYACDGWVCKKDNGLEIGLCLSNQMMINQIVNLLLRLGIVVSLRKKAVKLNRKEFNTFIITILDQGNILKFYKKITIMSQRKNDRLSDYCNSIDLSNTSKRHAYTSYFPKELWKIIEEKCTDSNITLRAMLSDVCDDVNYYCKSRKKNRVKKYNLSFSDGINPDLLKKIAVYLKDDFLLSLCDGDIIFDEITKIEAIGKHQCYDLTIPITHNFIANDIIVHNTGFLFQLALNMAKLNDNIMVLFMSIDDSRQQAIARIVALESGLKINQVTHPVQNIKNDEDMDKLNAGWNVVRKLISDNKFSLKDNSHGNTLDFAEGWVRWAKEKYPEKEIVFFLDNFHKLGDELNKDERIRFKHASARIHAMKNKLHFTAICTMEIRKLIGTSKNKRPSLQDISESKQMEYDNNLIGMVYNDLHANRHESNIIWVDSVDGVDVRKPVFEVDIQKNKISDFKEILYYKFAPEYSKFMECSREEINNLEKDMKQALKQVNDRWNPSGGTNSFMASDAVDTW